MAATDEEIKAERVNRCKPCYWYIFITGQGAQCAKCFTSCAEIATCPYPHNERRPPARISRHREHGVYRDGHYKAPEGPGTNGEWC